MTDFQLVLRAVGAVFFTSMVLAVLVVGIDAISHLPLADYLVKKFGDIMTLCVGALVGLLAGQKLESRKRLED